MIIKQMFDYVNPKKQGKLERRVNEKTLMRTLLLFESIRFQKDRRTIKIVLYAKESELTIIDCIPETFGVSSNSNFVFRGIGTQKPKKNLSQTIRLKSGWSTYSNHSKTWLVSCDVELLCQRLWTIQNKQKMNYCFSYLTKAIEKLVR